MSEGYRPTMKLRLRLMDECEAADKPGFVLSGWRADRSSFFALEQLWESHYVGEEAEWRHIEMAETAHDEG